MQNLTPYKVDLDTPQPGGRQGESPDVAFLKYNEVLDLLMGAVDYVGGQAPPNPYPYMSWIDSSTNPAVLKKRNPMNTGWVTIGDPLALALVAVANKTDTTAGRVANVGYMGLGTKDCPVVNLRDENQPAGFYSGSGAQEPGTNIPWGGTGFYGSGIVTRRGTASNGINMFIMDGHRAGHVSHNFNDNIWQMVEYLTTGNCEVITNANGTAIRFKPLGIQICISPQLTLPYSTAAWLETAWVFPVAFKSLINVQATFRGNGANQINWPEPYKAHTAYATATNSQTNVALYPPIGKQWSTNSSATGVCAVAFGTI